MDNLYRHIVLNFDIAKQPKFEEKKGKGYVEFGDDNNYPKYLLNLYNESPKHGAIIKSKAQYIYGQGFEVAGVANNMGETWNDIVKKCIKDDELYRGYYLQIIWNRGKKISDIFHIDFQKVRVSKDCEKFYVKNDWADFKEKPRVYDKFNPNNPVGSQIFYFKEYNPASIVYPLPSYMQGLNMIESDIQVSRHILGMANRQFVASKLIQLNQGEPPDENKAEVERGLLKKFGGHNGQQVVIMFNKSKDNAAEIMDLGTTSLTKEDFTNINNLIQQEIFACHQITSSSLFGIATAGALGERNALRDAYEIWNNTYCKYRQQEFNDTFTKLRNMKGEAGEFKLKPVEPLKFEFSEAIMSANLTQDEIREIMGREPLNKQEITADGSKAISNEQPQEMPVNASNDALRNLTGRQYQNVMRIVRNFGNGKLTKEQASLMLRSGYGLSDSDINAFLGIDEDPLTDDDVNKFNDQENERLYDSFASCGDDWDNYEIVKSIPYRQTFASDPNYIYQLEANVLDVLLNYPKATPEDIAKVLKVNVPDVQEALDSLVKKKIIDVLTTKVGNDTLVERRVIKDVEDLSGKMPKVEEVTIRYTYEFRVAGSISNSRPFCKKLYGLSAHRGEQGGKTWSMTDIQNMSLRLGYSVLDRCGGWWNNNGKIEYQCRHEWVANIVKKKK